jgi:hypothetical protein
MLKIFDTSYDNFQHGGIAGFKSRGATENILFDGEEIDITHSDEIHRGNKTVSLSNAPLGWYSTTDNLFAVAQYGSHPTKGMSPKDIDLSGNRNGALEDRKIEKEHDAYSNPKAALYSGLESRVNSVKINHDILESMADAIRKSKLEQRNRVVQNMQMQSADVIDEHKENVITKSANLNGIGVAKNRNQSNGNVQMLESFDAEIKNYSSMKPIDISKNQRAVKAYHMYDLSGNVIDDPITLFKRSQMSQMGKPKDICRVKSNTDESYEEFGDIMRHKGGRKVAKKIINYTDSRYNDSDSDDSVNDR